VVEREGFVYGDLVLRKASGREDDRYGVRD